MLLYRREDKAETVAADAAAADKTINATAGDVEPEPEVEGGSGGSTSSALDAVDAMAQAAMREMEEELQVENLRLLRRERMYAARTRLSCTLTHIDRETESCLHHHHNAYVIIITMLTCAHQQVPTCGHQAFLHSLQDVRRRCGEVRTHA